MSLTAEDVKPQADAMRTIREALAPFPPEEQMVMLSGALGDVLCTVGPVKNRHAAICLVGTAVDMMFDMIGRNFPDNRTRLSE